jgi:hypothetical protein
MNDKNDYSDNVDLFENETYEEFKSIFKTTIPVDNIDCPEINGVNLFKKTSVLAFKFEKSAESYIDVSLDNQHKVLIHGIVCKKYVATGDEIIRVRIFPDSKKHEIIKGNFTLNSIKEPLSFYLLTSKTGFCFNGNEVVFKVEETNNILEEYPNLTIENFSECIGYYTEKGMRYMYIPNDNDDTGKAVHAITYLFRNSVDSPEQFLVEQGTRYKVTDGTFKKLEARMKQKLLDSRVISTGLRFKFDITSPNAQLDERSGGQVVFDIFFSIIFK